MNFVGSLLLFKPEVDGEQVEDVILNCKITTNLLLMGRRSTSELD